VGHTLRFYYRTLDRHNIQLQRAPRAYVDSVTASSYQAAYLQYLSDPDAAEAASLAEVDYRTYKLNLVAALGDPNLRIAVLEFGQWQDEDSDPSTLPIWAEAKSSAGMTVAVNYSYWPSAAEVKFVWGELHTVSPGGSQVALDHATIQSRPITVMAVNGVSARARAWWLGRNGRQKMTDIESCFLPTALGLLPRVR
jgi:hypothetical protein